MAGLEMFIAARRDEGYTHVVISHDGGCFGWGRSPDEAWNMAVYFANNRLAPDGLLDSQLFDTEPRSAKIEDWDAYQRRQR